MIDTAIAKSKAERESFMSLTVARSDRTHVLSGRVDSVVLIVAQSVKVRNTHSKLKERRYESAGTGKTTC